MPLKSQHFEEKEGKKAQSALRSASMHFRGKLYLRLCSLSHLTEKTFSVPGQHASTEVNKPWAWMANE